MTERSIEDLRAELRSLGYLTHGLERWFAQDPWKSSTFWGELLLLASKVGTLVSVFAIVPMMVVMVLRNWPVGISDVLVIALIDLVGLWGMMFLLIVTTGLLLRIRPSLTIERPIALMTISMVASGLFNLAIVGWWLGFAEGSSIVEIISVAVLVLVSFAATTVVVSAALLSFSIHESRQIPSIHRKPLTKPLAVTGAILLVSILAAVWLSSRGEESAPDPQVVVSPTSSRIALIAVEGLTHDLFVAQPGLSEHFASVRSIEPLVDASPAATWATIGTGVPSAVHAVRAIDAVRIRGGQTLQSVSAWDVFLRRVGPVLHLTEIHALPPSVRLRRYAWEELARRGVPSVAINWWATEDRGEQNLLARSQATIFAMAAESGSEPRALAIAVDRVAAEQMIWGIETYSPRFATAYLPGLDIILNRLDLDAAARLGGSIATMQAITPAVTSALEQDMDVILVGLPGAGQAGSGVVATTRIELPTFAAIDLAPTVLDLFGFPASAEMLGQSRVLGSTQPKIPSYGPRSGGGQGVDSEEYYESLRSLGYIQ